MPSLGGWEIVIIIGILVLLFGAKKLPDMARSIGQSARVFKGEMKGLKNDDGTDKADGRGADADRAPGAPATRPAPSAALPVAPPVVAEPAAVHTPEVTVAHDAAGPVQEPVRAAPPGPGNTRQ